MSQADSVGWPYSLLRHGFPRHYHGCQRHHDRGPHHRAVDCLVVLVLIFQVIVLLQHVNVMLSHCVNQLADRISRFGIRLGVIP